MQTNLQDNASAAETPQARFSTFGGVFTPCVLTILGVIMFMRTGFVVGHTGLYLALVILGLSKLITTLTALSISAISTNTEIKGGGVYYMISRVLGPDFGGSIGITLYLAQAVGVAFYVIGFTEALFSAANPALEWIHIAGENGLWWADRLYLEQVISSLVVLFLFKLTFKGADIAIKAQYIVLGILMLAVLGFLIGGFLHFDQEIFATAKEPRFSNGMSFWAAFAIFFPAATGITAGANMSGDLKQPARSIPWGTLLAIVFTASIYVAQIVLMAGSTASHDLKTGPFEALQHMSILSPLIVLGVFAATISSALGSFLGAPRILQAMGNDRLMRSMVFFGKGEGSTNEPRRATVLTFIIAVAVIWAGDLNAVAEVISMFFLIAYGMINLSAFVESKGRNPSFRPTFKYFHWVTALVGAIGCGVAMMKINDTYALIALGVTGLIYFYLKKRDIKTTYGDAKRGFVFQRTKDNLLHLQGTKPHPKNWRPIMVTVSEDPIQERALLRAGGWLESKRGLHTVLHVIATPNASLIEKLDVRKQKVQSLEELLDAEHVLAFGDVLVTHDVLSGLADFFQSYAIGALRPNTVLLEIPPLKEQTRKALFLAKVDIVLQFGLNLVLFKPGQLAPTKRQRQIDLWWHDEKNSSLMALFAYLMTLDATWSGSRIRFLDIAANDQEERRAQIQLEKLKSHIRIPVDVKVIRASQPPTDVILEESGATTDLIFLGMSANNALGASSALDALEPLLERLPTTIVVWSNGEADIFA